MKDAELRPVFVDQIPEQIEQGVLYVSEKYEIAIHLCACGWCGEKTVTPFHDSQTGWHYTRDAQDHITLHPSIGNQNMPCRSHYWVKGSKIEWC